MGSMLSYPALDKSTAHGTNELYAYAVSAMQGWRITMEDKHAIDMNLEEDKAAKAFFGVYDGHSGGETSKYASQNLHKRLVNEEAYSQRDYKKALKRAFLDTDEDMIANLLKEKSGCCAVVALFTDEHKVYVANAGDSRAVLSVNGKSTPLSEDHKPALEAEAARITAAGGYIETGRVNGHLNLTRALGDFQYKQNKNVPPEHQMITADPEIMEHTITDEDEFIVLGCDGIWECLSSQQVIDVVRVQVSQGKPLHEITENICELCVAPDSQNENDIGMDNMTVLIVALLNGKSLEAWYAKVKDRVENRHGHLTRGDLPRVYSVSRMEAFQKMRVRWEEREKRSGK